MKKQYSDYIYKCAQFNFRPILDVNSSGMLEKIQVLDYYPHYQSNFVREHVTCNFMEKICICWILLVCRRKRFTLHYIMSRFLLSNVVINEKKKIKR